MVNDSNKRNSYQIESFSFEKLLLENSLKQPMFVHNSMTYLYKIYKILYDFQFFQKKFVLSIKLKPNTKTTIYHLKKQI
jgi:hypothetical protein